MQAMPLAHWNLHNVVHVDVCRCKIVRIPSTPIMGDTCEGVSDLGLCFRRLPMTLPHCQLIM